MNTFGSASTLERAAVMVLWVEVETEIQIV